MRVMVSRYAEGGGLTRLFTHLQVPVNLVGSDHVHHAPEGVRHLGEG